MKEVASRWLIQDSLVRYKRAMTRAVRYTHMLGAYALDKNARQKAYGSEPGIMLGI